MSFIKKRIKPVLLTISTIKSYVLILSQFTHNAYEYSHKDLHFNNHVKTVKILKIQNYFYII